MEPVRHRYFVLNKPQGMVSQFVSPHAVGLLGHINFAFPEGTHAIGRLDSDSEGLLLLTTNKQVTRLLFNSGVPHLRTYLVQVRRKVGAEALHRLRTGITIPARGTGNYTTPPCAVTIIDPPALFPSPFAYAHQIESSWLSISLSEGKYRQVRKMVAAAGHRCMRLVRVAIEDLHLGSLQPGCVAELEEERFFTLLKIDPAK